MRSTHINESSAKRAFGVGFNLRYYPAFRCVRETIQSGRIGKLDHLRVYGGHEGLPKFAHEWEYKAPISGGGAARSRTSSAHSVELMPAPPTGSCS